MTPDELRDAARSIVDRTTAEQGKPLHVADPATLARLALVLSPVPAERRHAPKAASRRPSTPSSLGGPRAA
jgi:hypothetical protein